MHEKKNSALVMLSVSLAAIALWNVALPVWNGASLSDSLRDISGCCAAASAWGVPLLIAGMGCRYLTGDPV